MGQIHFNLGFDNLRLGPGASRTYIEDNVSQIEAKLRWFTAVPLNSLIDDFIWGYHRLGSQFAYPAFKH